VNATYRKIATVYTELRKGQSEVAVSSSALGTSQWLCPGVCNGGRRKDIRRALEGIAKKKEQRNWTIEHKSLTSRKQQTTLPGYTRRTGSTMPLN
jgi:hypothetical protein